MKTPIPPPVFVRAHVRLTVRGQDYALLNQQLSIYGLAGIRWPHFPLEGCAGEEARIVAEIQSGRPLTLDAAGWLSVEETHGEGVGTAGCYLGVRANWSEEQKTKLAAAIAAAGAVSTAYIRKYPRIPASASIPDIPLRAVGRAPSGAPVTFDILNLSPGGILLGSDNPQAGFFTPGTRIHVEVEPRRLSLDPFEFDGLICRRTTEMVPEKRALRRLFGIRFTKITEKHKRAFLDILRSVLLRLTPPASSPSREG